MHDLIQTFWQGPLTSRIRVYIGGTQGNFDQLKRPSGSFLFSTPRLSNLLAANPEFQRLADASHEILYCTKGNRISQLVQARRLYLQRSNMSLPSAFQDCEVLTPKTSLTIVQHNLPALGPREVGIKITATAINPVDY
jgi:hypothetical protein